MNYLRAYQFIFDSKNWFMNLLMGVVCGFIPILGDVVFTGYLFEVIDALHEDPDHRDYPDFDFNRFGKYLMRGIWPVLAVLLFAFLVGVPLIVVALIPMFIGGFASDFAASKTMPLFVGMGVSLALSVLLEFVFSLVAMGAILHAGLARELRFGELLSFIRDFTSRVWKDLLLVELFLLLTAPVLMMVGFLMCIVGAYFVQVWIDMALHHLLFQLYERYLERGGSPIRAKPHAA